MILLLGLSAPAAMQAARPKFGANLGFNLGAITVFAVQPDGKLIVGGYYRTRLARLNADGSLDLGFRIAPEVDALLGTYVQRVIPQPDGRLLVLPDKLETAWLRLNADGSLDSSFHPPDFTEFFPQPDGTLLLIRGGAPKRLNTDGSVDESFRYDAGVAQKGSVLSALTLPNGRLLVVSAEAELYTFSTLNADGSLDKSFSALLYGARTNGVSGFNPDIHALAFQPDGKLLVGGIFAASPGGDPIGIVRFTAEGQIDGSFHSGFGQVDKVTFLSPQASGKILVGGSFGYDRFSLARLNADGSVDERFQSAFDFSADYTNGLNFAASPDGKIYIQTDRNIIRLNANGRLDAAFRLDRSAGPDGPVSGAVPQSDGKILLSGSFTRFNGVPCPSFIRLNADGSLDKGFSAPEGVGALLLLPDGKIIAGGSPLVRLNTDGSLDPGFDASAVTGGGSVYAVALQPDGKIVLGGYALKVSDTRSASVVRLNADGSLDADFEPSVLFANDSLHIADYELGVIHCVVVQPDGKIVVGGEFGSRVTRFNADGSADLTFKPTLIEKQGSGRFYEPVNISSVDVLEPQVDGKLLIAGDFRHVGGQKRRGLARLNADGSLDVSFDSDLPKGTTVSRFASAPAGLLVSLERNGNKAQLVRRNSSDGRLDPEFVSPSFEAGTVFSLAVQVDGQTVIGGSFVNFGKSVRNFVARFAADGSVAADFVPGSNPSGELPTVSLAASAITTGADGQPKIRFTVGRLGGDYTKPLRVHYSVAGTAENGTDYETLPGIVNIASGELSAAIMVAPLSSGSDSSSDKRIVLALESRKRYLVNAQALQAETTIHAGGE